LEHRHGTNSFSSKLKSRLNLPEVFTSRNFTDSSPAPHRSRSALHPLMEYNGTPRIDAFTQGCRDFLRTFTYEDILAWTIYAAPLVFMIGPAAILAHDPMMSVMLHSVIGFSLGWILHRMGHRLLARVMNGTQRIMLARSLTLPVKLKLNQFIWMLEILAGAAVFSGLMAKRCFLAGGSVGVLTGLALFAGGLALFFLPVHLGRLWMECYDPTMTLVGPTDDEINRSIPVFRSFFT
jgi:hypothetical protein